jgi:hypothetical protein
MCPSTRKQHEQAIHGTAPVLTSSVELERGLKLDLLLGAGCLCVCLLRCIETIHICLMMLRVVELHNLARDMRFECLNTYSTVSFRKNSGLLKRDTHIVRIV